MKEKQYIKTILTCNYMELKCQLEKWLNDPLINIIEYKYSICSTSNIIRYSVCIQYEIK